MDEIPWGKMGCGLFVLVLTIVLIGWGGSWFGLWATRPQQVYQEETRAQVYDSSRQYNQGTNRDIARYCEQMRTSEGSAKRAVAALIRTTASTYDGELSVDNRQCVADANGVIQ